MVTVLALVGSTKKRFGYYGVLKILFIRSPRTKRRIGSTKINIKADIFQVMAEITRILAANIRRQFFFVIATAASTCCLVQNFQLICYSQRVNATSQYNDSGSSTCSKWLNDRMVAVVKHCWLLVQGRRCCRER